MNARIDCTAYLCTLLSSANGFAKLVGERRWNVYVDGRVEVRLPENDPERAWRRLAAQQRESGLLGRAIKSVDLRHPAWLTLELADELQRVAAAKAPGA